MAKSCGPVRLIVAEIEMPQFGVIGIRARSPLSSSSWKPQRVQPYAPSLPGCLPFLLLMQRGLQRQISFLISHHCVSLGSICTLGSEGLLGSGSH